MDWKPPVMKKSLAIAIVSLVPLVFGCQKEPVPEQTAIPRPPAASSPSPGATATPGGEVGMVSGALQPDVQMDKEVYRPGEQINVTAVATGLADSAWIGVVPSQIPHGKESDNDSNDLGFHYLRDGSKFFLVAPDKPGEYDVRFNDDDADGKEVASRSFKVEPDPNPVNDPRITWEPPAEVEAGSVMDITFEVPTSFAEDAWIGVVPSATAHGSEEDGDAADLVYQPLDGRSRGVASLKAPAEAGDYDVRIYDSDSKGKEVASVSFKVK